MRRDEERERSLISFDGEDNNNNTKKKKDTFFFAIRKYAQKGLLHATDGTRSTSFFLSLSLYKYALWSAVRVWVMRGVFCLTSDVPTDGKTAGRRTLWRARTCLGIRKGETDARPTSDRRRFCPD